MAAPGSITDHYKDIVVQRYTLEEFNFNEKSSGTEVAWQCGDNSFRDQLWKEIDAEISLVAQAQWEIEE
jgi:hypothetical protein